MHKAGSRAGHGQTGGRGLQVGDEAVYGLCYNHVISAAEVLVTC
jgi:hypothetical protein